MQKIKIFTEITSDMVEYIANKWIGEHHVVVDSISYSKCDGSHALVVVYHDKYNHAKN